MAANLKVIDSRSEERTCELQSRSDMSYGVFVWV